MTKVTSKFGTLIFSLVILLCAASLSAQVSGAASTNNSSLPELRSAESLYTRLSSVGLDKNRIYTIREASLDRAAIHISLDDGTIGFTEDVAGRVTGAFFQGDGEILLMPSDQAERGSMALFTGAAILEEKFGTAYFRFNDDTFQQLAAFMLPAESAVAADFYSRWNDAAKNLATMDALRLFISFSQFLPPGGAPASANLAGDRLFHARLQGRHLGDFDAYYDSTASEQIWVGQSKVVDSKTYYDMWSSFALRGNEARQEKLNSVNGEIGGANPVAVTNYKITTTVKPPTEISSDAVLQLEAQQGGERTLIFELSRFLNVQRVEANGKEVEFIHNPSAEGTQTSRRGNDLVVVLLPEPLRKGQKLQLHFVYSGGVLSKAGEGLLYVGDKGTWYPNVGFSYANFDLRFRYPQAWTLIATGNREAAEPASPALAPDEQSSRWVSQRPIPVAGFNLGEYKEAQAQAGAIKVDVYATRGVEKDFPKAAPAVVATLPSTPGRGQPAITLAPNQPNLSPARNAQRVADETAEAVTFFEHHFGPFPYRGLSVTQIPGVVSQGWPGLVFLSTYAFLSNQDRSRLQIAPVQQTLSDTVVAHETAHQWWGDLVGWNSYRDQWMIEALANYSSMMLLESQDPTKFQAVMDFYRKGLLEKQKNDKPLMDAGPVTLGVRLSCSEFPHGYAAISYGRGTWLLHMLREMMDEGAANHSTEESSGSPFMHALLKLRTKYEGKALTTQEMLHVFEDEMPRSTWYEGSKSLDWFYSGWINGTAIPKLELKDVKFSHSRNTTTVSGTITQSDAPDSLVTSVPLYAVTNHGHSMVFLTRMFADGPESTFRLRVPAGTRKVVLDPYNSVLSRP